MAAEVTKGVSVVTAETYDFLLTVPGEAVDMLIDGRGNGPVTLTLSGKVNSAESGLFLAPVEFRLDGVKVRWAGGNILNSALAKDAAAERAAAKAAGKAK